MTSLVAGYRPAHLTEEPLHTPRLPLRGVTGARIRTHHARPCYLFITPLQEWLAAFVLTMARPEAIDRAESGEELRSIQRLKDLGDRHGKTWGQWKGKGGGAPGGLNSGRRGA